MNVASLGAPALRTLGADDATNDFAAWLTARTNATVSFITSQPAEITPERLANYDVILLQDLRAWTLSSAEVLAIQSWIREGGGVIALSGYSSDDAKEIEPTNAIVSNTGMKLLTKESPAQVCPDSSMSLCPNATSACCYCWGNLLPITEWNTSSPFSDHITALGGYRGRAVDAGIDGTVVATFDGTAVAASKQVGQGKVFLYGDDSVTYVRWWGEYGQTSGNIDAFNPCWDSKSTPPAWRTAGHVFQPKQFWYNAIVNVAPPTECRFEVSEPDVILVK